MSTRTRAVGTNHLGVDHGTRLEICYATIVLAEEALVVTLGGDDVNDLRVVRRAKLFAALLNGRELLVDAHRVLSLAETVAHDDDQSRRLAALAARLHVLLKDPGNLVLQGLGVQLLATRRLEEVVTDELVRIIGVVARELKATIYYVISKKPVGKA